MESDRVNYLFEIKDGKLFLGGYQFDEYKIEGKRLHYVRTEQDTGYFSGGLIIRQVGEWVFLQNVVDEEDYVASCTQYLVGADTLHEHIKAVSVVLRTFIYHLLSEGIYMLPDSLPYWKYTGISNASEYVKKAVQETKGEILIYLNKPIYPLITYCTGGFTVPYEEIFYDSVDYSIAVEDSLSLSSPYYSWEISLPKEKLIFMLGLERLDSIKTESYTIHLIPETIAFYDGDDVLRVKGVSLYQTLSPLLHSPLYRIEFKENNIVFKGHGKGILIGLPLWSSKKMAEKGYTYKEILNHYFPVSVLYKLDQSR